VEIAAVADTIRSTSLGVPATERAESKPWDLIRIMPAWESESHLLELYDFIRGTLAWAVSVTALWPANVPLMALAYKVRHGPNPIAMKPAEFWTRATFAALLVGLLSLVMVGVDYVLAESAGFPAGPIHMVILIGFIPLAAWILFVFLALEDLMQATSVLVIYICLPVLVLYVLNAIVGFWEPLVDIVNGWLKRPE
jgi:hypothetical protein